MDTKTILSEASDRMQKTIEHLEEELLNIRAGKATPTVLNGVFVDYYGSQQRKLSSWRILLRRTQRRAQRRTGNRMPGLGM